MTGGSPSPGAGAGVDSGGTVRVTPPRAKLSADGMTLEIRRRAAGGVQVVTFERQRDAGPFTAAEVAVVLGALPSGTGMQVGQRNRTRRWAGRFGTVWGHLMLGPPTWWVPQLGREADGTFLAGWLRVALAVRFEPDWEEIIFAVVGIIGDLVV
jgi:hypothetical protein